MRGLRAKYPHHSVTDELLDLSAVRLDGVPHLREVAAQNDAKHLRIQTLSRRRRSHQVAKYSSDRLPRISAVVSGQPLATPIAEARRLRHSLDRQREQFIPPRVYAAARRSRARSRDLPDAIGCRTRFDDRMIIYRHLTLMAALAAALLVAGCGGAGSTPGSHPDPLSHAQLVQRADALCRTYNHRFTVEFPDGAPTQAEWDGHVAEFDQLIADLRTLRPSANDRAAYTAWIDAGERQRPLIVAAGPAGSDAEIGKLVLAAANVNAMAAGMGMSDCAVDVDETETPMSKSRYIDIADGLCAASQAALGQVPAPDTLPDFDRAMKQMMPVITMVQRDLRAIPVPDGDGGRLDAWLHSRDIVVQDIQAMWDAARTGDQNGFGQASQAVTLGAKASGRMAAGYGIDCGTT